MTRKSLSVALVALSTACSGATGGYVPGELADRRPAPITRQSAAPTATSAELASSRPEPLARRRSPLAKPVEARLSSGMRVLLLERHEFPAVKVSFVLDRGAVDSPSGVAALYAHALRGASQEYSSEEAFGYLRYMGAELRTRASEDSVVLSVSALTPLLAGSLRRAAGMFFSPKLEGKDLEDARTAARAEAKRALDDPHETARTALRTLVLSEQSSYARPVWATDLRRYEAMSRQELVNFHRMFVVPERVTVIVLGDFHRGSILQQLEHVTAGVARRRSSAPPPLVATGAPTAARLVVVPRPGASQSNIAVGFVAPRGGDPTHAALSVLASLLGRSLSGRLDLKTRGEHGWTYGVRMRTRGFRDVGVVEITTAVETAHTAEALKGLLAELARVPNEPIDERELSRAKQHASELGDEHALTRLAVSGLPLEQYDDLTSRIERLTEPDVRTAAQQVLATGHVQIAVVGDADAIVGPLRALGLADVTVRDAPRPRP